LGLDLSDRGALERIIEIRIEEIPDIMRVFRNQDIRERHQIRNADEFAYGYIYGKIIATFEAHMITTHQKEMSQDKVNEMFSITEKRTKEIKDAIYKCG